jgi:hypothetical protein
MTILKKVLISLLLLGFVVSIYGCGAALRNAQLTPELKAKEWKPKVREMANNIGDYDIWAAGQSKTRPWAIVFHPKDNPKKLDGTPDRWHKLEDKNVLDDIIGWMEANGTNIPRLMSLLGPAPDRAFFAYVYTPLAQMNTRIVDENTIFVYEPDPAMMPLNM